MGKIIPINVRIDSATCAAIDTDLEREQRGVLGVKLSRSDWVRAAIERKLMEIASNVQRKKRRRPWCLFCGKVMARKNLTHWRDHPDGYPEYVCRECAKERLIDFLPPK